MNTRKAYTNVIVFILVLISILNIGNVACDDPSTVLTSPVTNAEQTIINAVDGDCTDNVLSGC